MHVPCQDHMAPLVLFVVGPSWRRVHLQLHGGKANIDNRGWCIVFVQREQTVVRLVLDARVCAVHLVNDCLPPSTHQRIVAVDSHVRCLIATWGEVHDRRSIQRTLYRSSIVGDSVAFCPEGFDVDAPVAGRLWLWPQEINLEGGQLFFFVLHASSILRNPCYSSVGCCECDDDGDR